MEVRSRLHSWWCRWTTLSQIHDGQAIRRNRNVSRVRHRDGCGHGRHPLCAEDASHRRPLRHLRASCAQYHRQLLRPVSRAPQRARSGHQSPSMVYPYSVYCAKVRIARIQHVSQLITATSLTYPRSDCQPARPKRSRGGKNPKPARRFFLSTGKRFPTPATNGISAAATQHHRAQAVYILCAPCAAPVHAPCSRNPCIC